MIGRDSVKSSSRISGRMPSRCGSTKYSELFFNHTLVTPFVRLPQILSQPMPQTSHESSTVPALPSGIGNSSRFLKFNSHGVWPRLMQFSPGTPRPGQFQCLASLGISVRSIHGSGCPAKPNGYPHLHISPKDSIADQAESGARRKGICKFGQSQFRTMVHSNVRTLIKLLAGRSCQRMCSMMSVVLIRTGRTLEVSVHNSPITTKVIYCCRVKLLIVDLSLESLEPDEHESVG